MNEDFNKVRDFLLDLEFDIDGEDPEEGVLRISDEEKGVSNMVIDCEEDILIIEQFIFQLKEPDYHTLQRLLQINREILHGALVLDEEGKRVIFRDTLQLENLDRNELEGSINALGLMLAEHGAEFMDYAHFKEKV